MNQMQAQAMERVGELAGPIFRTPCSVGSGEVVTPFDNYPKDALEAFERHRVEQTKILGMPGLNARPCFMAGWNARGASVQQSEALRGHPGAAQYLRWVLEEGTVNERIVANTALKLMGPPAAMPAAPSDAVLAEHSGCGGSPQWEQVSVRLNPGDKVVLVKGGAAPAATATALSGVVKESIAVIRGIMEFIRLHAKPGGFDPALAESRVNARLDKIDAAIAAATEGAES